MNQTAGKPEPAAQPLSGTQSRPRFLGGLRDLLPHFGAAGSRSARLHTDVALAAAPPLDATHRRRLHIAIILGLVGTLMMTVGGLGAGAFPVVNNPYWGFPGVNFLAKMIHSATVLVFCGIAFLVTGWLLLSRFAVPSWRRPLRPIPTRTMWRIFGLWSLPLMVSPPLFTQDIYSYLAQGKIAALGLDPYTAGPVDVLGVTDPLARSVPLIWAYSPAPYGPVALGYGAVISWLTGNSIPWGIFSHRIVCILGLALAGWALVKLAERCAVRPQAALWLGILNPLAILHLVGGIHNEAVMLGLLLAGLEITMRGTDPHRNVTTVQRWLIIIAGLAITASAGMVKITAFIALGFGGVAIARWLGGRFHHLVAAAIFSGVIAGITIVTLSYATGVGLGWIHSQGGAAEVKSWMSLPTTLGQLSARLGAILGLGDHERTALTIFRGLGLAIGVMWLIRMLWASYKGRIHPVGALGVATLILVFFFPVVHPWYLLWAILPLAAWANRALFRVSAVLYSTIFSFALLPRGLELPSTTVAYIYVMSALLLLLLWTLSVIILGRIPAWQQAMRSESLAATTSALRSTRQHILAAETQSEESPRDLAAR